MVGKTRAGGRLSRAGARRSDVAARAGLASANLGLDLHLGLSVESSRPRAEARVSVVGERACAGSGAEAGEADGSAAADFGLDLHRSLLWIERERREDCADYAQPRGKLPAWTLVLIFMCVLLLGVYRHAPRPRWARSQDGSRAAATRTGFDAGLDLHVHSPVLCADMPRTHDRREAKTAYAQSRRATVPALTLVLTFIAYSLVV